MKLLKIEKARQREVEFKEDRKKENRENNNRGDKKDKLESFEGKHVPISPKLKDPSKASTRAWINTSPSL